MDLLASAGFWIGLVEITRPDIIPLGDNAMDIASAARSPPPEQHGLAVFSGSGVAVVLRSVPFMVAEQLMQLSLLQIVRGCLLLWIGGPVAWR